MDRFKEFLSQPRQRPTELESARMRRVLSGLPNAGTGSSDASGSAYSDVVSELRAVRSEVSTLRELLERGCGAPVHDEVLTRSQAAQLLHVCIESITKLVRDEGLPCKRVGKEYRFLRSQVMAWFADRRESMCGGED